MWLTILIPSGFLSFAAAFWWRRRAVESRQQFIDNYRLPAGLLQRVRQTYPALDDKQLALVDAGLRQFFRCSLLANKQAVAMPSQVVDELWHNFILYTRNYQQFCKRAFGHYLHHTPAVVMGGRKSQQGAIRRAWHLACKEEGIQPGKPSRLPLLFELDALLAIANGFVYRPDCRLPGVDNSGSYCGADLGSDSGCASCSGGGSSDSSWFGSDASSDSADATSDSGGGDSGGDSGCSGGCSGGD